MAEERGGSRGGEWNREIPEVTWLLPVRNGMPHLRETLASIEAQTYANWQILAWDNGSTDGSVEELEQWIPSRLPGRVVKDHPLPLAESLARMVRECSSELCARIDADDVNHPERLEWQVRHLLAHPEIAVLGTQMSVIAADGSTVIEEVRFPVDHEEIVRHLLMGPGVGHPTVMFRRSAVLEAGNYRDVGEVNVEDYDLWLRLAVRQRFANLEQTLLRYRVHDGSTTVASDRAGKLRTAVAARLRTHAPALYGWSPAETERLLSRSHPCALVPFVRMARHLDRLMGGGALATLRSRCFLRGAPRLVAPSDLVTRCALWALAASARGLRRRAKRRGGGLRPLKRDRWGTPAATDPQSPVRG